MLHLFAFCCLLNISYTDQPTVTLIPNTGEVDETPSESWQLLSKARGLKAAGSQGYGDFYRRAAWAARRDAPEDVSVAVLILDELLASPESVFDVFDAQRSAGQMYISDENWAESLNRYRASLQLARIDPMLVEAHPVLFVSVMQGATIAAASMRDPALAAGFAVELRDHPCVRIPVSAKRAASLSAARYFFQAGDAEACVAAWTRASQIAPDLFSGRNGVHTRLERANALADLLNSVEPLEDLWNAQGVRDYDTSLLIALNLAARYKATGQPWADESAYSVLSEAWNEFVAREQHWRSTLEPADLAALTHHSKILLHRATGMAITLELWGEVLGLAQAYQERFDSASDRRGAAWISIAMAELNNN